MLQRFRTSAPPSQTSAPRKPSKTAHVIVCGNEKGGSGKTTTTMHLIIHLMKAGFKVASLDLDARQQSLTRYIQNRLNWSLRQGIDLELPTHYRFDMAMHDSVANAQSMDYDAFVNAVQEVESTHDFVVIDTPGSDSYLMRLAHSMADTLLTPMNDSFVDFDVLGAVDPHSLEITDVSHYAKMVREARRQRFLADDGLLDWIVVRNRLSSLVSRNQQKLRGCVTQLSMQLGYRVADGISERVIFREYFPLGLTALDNMDEVNPDGEIRSTSSHVAAREEVAKLVGMLRLPVDDISRQRAETRRVWMQAAQKPMALPDIFAD
ncbi:MAG: AAA family ATPase [Ahrensia sp.]|nr:AAA family ATPase [Ahrensia sp.]